MEEESKKVGLPVLLVLTGLGIASLFVWLFAELAEEVLENEMKALTIALSIFLKR
nr:hypothetical protein [Planococcus salinarum]